MVIYFREHGFMFRTVGILLFGLTVLFFATNSIGSVSVEEAIQKRIEMFKSSSANIKKLSKLIRSGDTSTAIQLVDFHVTWSEKMYLLFPIGSEASTLNGSDASSDIWEDLDGFQNKIQQYNVSSEKLKAALHGADFDRINENFEQLVGACKGCHKLFRN